MPKSVTSLWHRRTARSVIVAGLVAALLLAGGASAWAMSAGSSTDAGYRTATATVANVQQTLDSTGTLEPVDQATLEFQVNGQVAAVNVSVGQQVTAGEVLATLDTTSLEAAVTSAQSSVTADEEKLSSDEASESSASSTANSASTSSASGSAKGGTGNSGGIGAQQAALVADQHKADADSMQAAGDLAQANAACATSGPSGGESGSSDGGASGAGGGSSASGDTGGTSGTSSGSGTTSGGSGSSGATCTAALQAALADQQTVSQDQQTVARDESALARSLDESSSSSGTQSPSNSTTTAAASPAQVAADQATLDADEATLSEADASLSQATLSSPISGTVVSVGVDAGQSVSADSSSAQIMIMSPGAYETSTTVSVSNIGEVEIGDAASVTLDGTTTPLAGSVTQIGPAPASSSSTTYPVVVSIPQDLTGIHDGASVSVSIVVSQANGVVAVPTSAVHHLSRTSYVTEIRNGSVQNVTVGVGTVGDLFTQITSGVKAGDTVVLANMSTPLPSSNSTFPTIAGGLGGGGLGGGGFPGGGGALRVG